MAQSSAAREPTMEEILASIRRIIESNDESAPPRVEPRPQLASIAGNAQGAAEAPVSLETATITEARPAEPKAPTGAAAVRAISLADVAARLRGHDERPAPTPAASVPPAVANDDRFAADEEPETDTADTPGAVAIGTFESERDGAYADEPEGSDEEPWAPLDGGTEMTEASSQRAEQREQTPLAFDLGEPLRKDEAASSAAQAETGSHAETSGASALVSMATGTKVAAAFDDLNSAITEGRMRSFEELAQELLRPMLSEWLDDNLPTLVERLVREEIERVARGGRR